MCVEDIRFHNTVKEIAHKLGQLSSHPSTDTLQRQLRLAEVQRETASEIVHLFCTCVSVQSMSHDGHKLSASIHQLMMEAQLQRGGWQSALTNTLSILRSE